MDTSALSELSLDLANQSGSSSAVADMSLTLPTIGPGAGEDESLILNAKPKRKYKKRPKFKSKMITGYIIYASEIRKEFVKKYPDKEFGFISKLVGLEWKNLPQETKLVYEKRANEHNAKSKAEMTELVMNNNLDTSNQKQQPQQAPQRFLQVIYQKQEPSTIVQHEPQLGTQVDYTTGSCDEKATNKNEQTIPGNHTQPVMIRNSIVYKKPSTIRLFPKDATTQTEPIKWASSKDESFTRNKLTFSDKFRDYLRNIGNDKLANQ